MKNLLIVGVSVFTGLFSEGKKETIIPEQYLSGVVRDYKSYAEEALLFCQRKQICTDFFILADFSIHSGKKRLFIWDFKTQQITNQFLVSHGCGNSATASDESKENPIFSNEPNSHCSSLGKYLLATKKTYSPNYGEKYLLYGQDPTNNNALKRDVVLHPWSIIPDEEPYPKGVPESWGCPAVSPSVFTIIDKKLQTTKKNVLFWIIYPK